MAVGFSSVQSLSHVRLFATPWTAAHQASLSLTNFQRLFKLMRIKLVMPSNHLILHHPQMFKLVLEKAEEPDIKLSTSIGLSKKQDSSRKTTFSALLTMPKLLTVFSSVQSLSCVRLFATPWTATHQASLSITNSRRTPKPVSIESVRPSNYLILHRHLLLLPSVFPSIRVF